MLNDWSACQTKSAWSQLLFAHSDVRELYWQYPQLVLRVPCFMQSLRHTYITVMTRQHQTTLMLLHATDTLLGQNTVQVLLSLVLMVACCNCLVCAESAFLPSTMHTQSTTSRRTGRGDACVSLGCVAALRICNERWKEGTLHDASDSSVWKVTNASACKSKLPCKTAPADHWTSP